MKLVRAARGLTVLAAAASGGYPTAGAEATVAPCGGVVPVADVVLENSGGGYRSAVFSPGGDQILVVADPPRAEVWTSGGEMLQSWTVEASAGVAPGLRYASFSPDGATVVTSSERGASMWDVSTGELIWELAGAMDDGAWTVQFSPDGGRLVTVDEQHPAEVWDPTTGELLAELDQVGEAEAVAFSPDGSRLFLTSFSFPRSPGYMWDLESLDADGQSLGEFTGWAYDAEFSPDGELVATAHRGSRTSTPQHVGSAHVWDADAGAEVYVFETGRDSQVWDLEFSPDGSLLVTASGPARSDGDSAVDIWDLADGSHVVSLPGIERTPEMVAFSPDGALLAVVGSDPFAALYDVATGNLVAELEGHTERVNHVDFASDGRSVMTAGSDGTVRVWTLEPDPASDPSCRA